jgi:DNA-directed RNA polymerase specialized sigma24 family protein
VLEEAGVREQREREYGEFVEARLDRLRRFGFLLCGDWHLAEDAVQTALTRLYVVWPRVSRVGEVDAYVRRIVVTSLADERRRGFRRRERSSAALPDRGLADHADATAAAGRDRPPVLGGPVGGADRAVARLHHRHSERAKKAKSLRSARVYVGSAECSGL